MKLNKTIFPDYFTQSDVVGTCGFAFLSVLFLAGLVKVKPNTTARSNSTVAIVESFSNQVRYKESGAVSFYDVASNEKLQNQDEVFTGESAGAVIRFVKSNTILKISSQSLIKIEDDQTINIKNGSVDVVLGSNQNINLDFNGEMHSVKSSTKPSTVKAYIGNGGVHFYTKDENVKVKSGNVEKKLVKNNDLVLSNLKDISNDTFKIEYPSPWEKIVDTGSIKIKTNKKTAQRVSISKDSEGINEIAHEKFDGDSLNWGKDLEEGNYYLKVENNLATKIIPITLVSKYKVDGISPVEGEIVSLTPTEKIKLKWNPLPVKSYKVTIKGKDGNDQVFITKKNELEVKNIKGSILDWSVAPEIEKGKFSNIKKMNRVGMKYNGNIELLSGPKENRFTANTEKIKLKIKPNLGENFRYKTVDAEKNIEIKSVDHKGDVSAIEVATKGKYKLIIESIDYPTLKPAEFSYEVYQPVLEWDKSIVKEVKSEESIEKVTLKNELVPNEAKNVVVDLKYYPKNSKAGEVITKQIQISDLQSLKLDGYGKYCLTASQITPRNYYSASKESCVNFVQIPVFLPLPKVKDLIMSYVKNNGVDAYKIEVNANAKAVKYEFEIYKDSKLTKMVFNTESKKAEMFWTSNRSGIYYFRYRVFDLKNRGSDFSPVSKLIFPISPLSDW